jgi:hypothetical protein
MIAAPIQISRLATISGSISEPVRQSRMALQCGNGQPGAGGGCEQISRQMRQVADG